MDEQDDIIKSISEELEEMYEDVLENWNVTSFSELESIDRSGDAIEDLWMLQVITSMMFNNIKSYSTDKIGSARKLVDEYYVMANAVLDEYSGVEENKEQRQSIIQKIKGVFEVFKSKAKKIETKEVDLSTQLVMKGSIGFCKDKSGAIRWFARYSNNFRDNDHPAEIISKESHMRFVDMVDKGLAPMPELWHWHIPGTMWGKADWVAYDEENGVAMASGNVLEGHEKEAEAIMDMDIEIGVSHGMPYDSVVRDPSDETIINEHITREISDLPLWAAANKLTSFSVLKETDTMAIPKQKKDYLRGMISEEAIEQIEQGNKEIADAANAQGIESKEQTPEPVAEEQTPDEPEVKEDATQTTQETTELGVATKEEVAEAIVELVKPLIDQIKSLSEQVDALKKAQEDEKKEKDEQPVPTASLAAMIAKNLGVSAIGSDSAQLRKNSTLAKSGPDETPVEDEQSNLVSTGNPVIDQVISGVIGRK